MAYGVVECLRKSIKVAYGVQWVKSIDTCPPSDAALTHIKYFAVGCIGYAKAMWYATDTQVDKY